MLSTAVPSGIYALADHLDGALAAGEDLRAVRLVPAADLAPDVAPETAMAEAILQLRRLEATLLLHLLQARRRAAEITSADRDMKTVLRLIGSTTDALLDLVDTFAPEKMSGLSALGDVQNFLRQRGIIAADAAGLSAFKGIEIDDRYRVGGLIELGPLLDMAASALDLLEMRYDLYDAEAPATGRLAMPPPLPVADAALDWDDEGSVSVELPGEKAIDASAAPDLVDEAAESAEAKAGTAMPAEAVAAMRKSLKAALDELNSTTH